MNDLLIHALIMVFGVVIAGVSQLLLKSAAQRTYKNWIYQYLNIRVILGYGIMVASTLCTVIAYRVLPLSMAPACDAFGRVFKLDDSERKNHSKKANWTCDNACGDFALFYWYII